ncbi:DUF2463 domain-containing protein [Dorea longicatena]|uniref:DUF2463 domain-containing protein n=1 Tax=Dorea longicatena TaxID=88431 RepID=A0A414S075_9FIRM|nr:DUF2463 domain-containing protein [Dorea longicatena]
MIFVSIIFLFIFRFVPFLPYKCKRFFTVLPHNTADRHCKQAPTAKEIPVYFANIPTISFTIITALSIPSTVMCSYTPWNA